MKCPDRLALAHLPTPIHLLPRLSTELGREIYIWRDDLTGFIESGNKIRKLEFLLADARKQGATRLITAGGAQSNHTRTTACLARRLGLEITIIVRERPQGRKPGRAATGNLFLNELFGADLTFISYADYQRAGSLYQPFLEQAAEASRRRGERPYVIPEGGSVPLGCWGYIRAVEEMLHTWKQCCPGSSAPDALFLALGSGGTHAGLQIGFQLHDLPVTRLWAVNVCDSEAYFQKRVGNLIAETVSGFQLDASDRKLQILDGHFGEGYGIASHDDLRFYMRLARQEGILLDPVYTGKAFRGMLAELQKTPDRFGGKILFLHSGGLFANDAYQEQYAKAKGVGSEY